MKTNKVFLAGNLVRDPELRYTPAGTAICEITIANSEKYKKDDEWVETTGFYNCICWAKRGEVIAEYFEKGKPIFIEGKLTFQQWENKEGQKVSAVKITILDFEFVGGKLEGGKGTGQATSAQNPSFPADKNDVNEEEIPF